MRRMTKEANPAAGAGEAVSLTPFTLSPAGVVELPLAARRLAALVRERIR